MKTVILLCLVLVFSLNGNAFELKAQKKSKTMPAIEQSIKDLCAFAERVCEIKTFKIKGIKNDGGESPLTDEILDEEVYKISKSVFLDESITGVDVELISKNASRLPKLKTHLKSVAAFASLRTDEAVDHYMNSLNAHIYNLAVKGGIYFSGGKTYSPKGVHTVFVAVRIAKIKSEGEVLVWDAGY